MNAISSNVRNLALSQSFRSKTLTANEVATPDTKTVCSQTLEPSTARQDLPRYQESFLREMLYFDRF